VVTHRIIVTPEAELQGHTPHEVIVKALAAVPVPRS
jgi:MoxR-like ATPase